MKTLLLALLLCTAAHACDTSDPEYLSCMADAARAEADTARDDADTARDDARKARDACIMDTGDYDNC